MSTIVNNATAANPAMDAGEGALGYLRMQNPVFSCYLFWASLLVIKMLLMSLLTAVQRFTTQTYANPEDVARKDGEVKFNNPNVERVRRCHRNDLENVLPFLIMSLVYVATGPNAILARILIRIGAIARIVHTGVYAFRPVPQPSRAIAFFVPLCITVFMGIYVIVRTIVYI